MGLQNVRVECARAESFDVRDGFDLVTSRAVGSPAALFEIAGRALRLEGVLMLYVSADQKFDQDVGAAAAAGLFDGISGYDLRHGGRDAPRDRDLDSEVNVEPALGSTPPWAGVTPAPSETQIVLLSSWFWLERFT